MDNALELPLLLDTHVWIWASENREDQLSRESLRTIDRISQNGTIYVSAISPWEIGMLSAKRRITLSTQPLVWTEQALQAPGIQLVPLVPPIAIDSTHLPGNPPNDPADRLIIATARYVSARLVTCDEHILKYAKTQGTFATLDARL